MGPSDQSMAASASLTLTLQSPTTSRSSRGVRDFKVIPQPAKAPSLHGNRCPLRARLEQLR